MKKVIKYILLLAVSGIVLASCNDDFLNTEPLDKALAETVWTDAALAEAAVTELYNGLSTGLLNQQSMETITDNALYNFGKQDIMEANVSPSNTGWVNDTYAWGNMYGRIRAANIALSNLAVPKFDNGSGIAERLKGETYFMRAYFYNQMLRYYGAIPIIKSPYTLVSADYTIARNTYKECVDFIISDLDSAALLLKDKTLATGRANYGATLALKSRVLTYAASDLHDVDKASSKSTVISAFPTKELLGYLPQDGSQLERWQKAKIASKAVMDLGIYGYKLDIVDLPTPEAGQQNYVNMNLSINGGERDAIFSRYYLNDKDEWGAWYARNNMPNGYHGWTSSQPTQNLVDDYEMMDGTKFDWNNPLHAAAPYEKRDPRFYATVLFDGAQWKPRTSDGKGIDPYGQIQMGQYQIVNGKGEVITYFGLDTRNSAIENWNGTRTGYAIRKFINTDPAIEDQNTRQEVPSVQIRFTEIVFNYIEACLELGEEAEALTWLNKIRFRVGMPPLTESGTALKERYYNERNVEMSFEEQRFYDARRWMIAPETLGQKARIIQITGTLKPGKKVSVYKYSKDDYNYTYKVQDIEVGVENRKWDDKMYFMPIQRDEINKNSKLVQNPGFN